MSGFILVAVLLSISYTQAVGFAFPFDECPGAQTVNDTITIGSDGGTIQETVVAAVTYNVSMNFSFQVHVNNPPPLDIYFLIDYTYASRNLWTTFQSTMLATMKSINATSPTTRFGCGTFITKRLFGIGTSFAYEFQNRVNMTTNLTAVANAIRRAPYPDMQTVSDITSALEALQQVILTSSSLGFRSNSTKLIVLVTNNDYGVAGDVKLYANVSNFTAPISANRGTAYLNGSCTLTGYLCPDLAINNTLGHGVLTAATAPPFVVCPTAMRPLSSINANNITQFFQGSCNDFPSLAQIKNISNGFQLLIVTSATYNVSEQSVYPLGSPIGAIMNNYRSLIHSFIDGGYIVNSPVTPSTLLGLFSSGLGTPQPPYPSPIESISIGNCNGTVCTVTITVMKTTTPSYLDVNLPIAGTNTTVSVVIVECLVPAPLGSSESSDSSESKKQIGLLIGLVVGGVVAISLVMLLIYIFDKNSIAYAKVDTDVHDN